MNQHKTLSFVIATAVVLAANAASADNWTSWRGPAGDNTAAPGQYPLKWTGEENIAWKVKLPGGGGSTPVVWEDRVFITGNNDNNFVMCLNRKGEQQWLKQLGEARQGKHRKASGSNPSPVTDGKHVYAYFKSGEFACLNFSGDVVWTKNLQKEYGADTLWWDLGTSPVLTKNAVVIAVMQSMYDRGVTEAKPGEKTAGSYIAAFNLEDGSEIWKQPRNLNAPSEAAQSNSTPVVTTENGDEVLVVLGADHVTCHNASDGKERWRIGGLNPTSHQYFRSIASPVVHQGMVVAPYGRGATITGVKLGGKGDVTRSHVKWTLEGNAPDVPSPAAQDGFAYVLADKGKVQCVDVKTSKIKWEGSLPKSRTGYSASPFIAGGHLYLTNEKGATTVLKLGDKFQVVATNQISEDGENTVASPVFVDGKILLRTYKHLYCIGAK